MTMKTSVRSLWSNIYIRGGLYFVSASFIINLSNYFLHFLAARILGLSNYGELTAFYSYINLFSVPMTVVSTVIIQRIASQTNTPFEYAQSLLFQGRRTLIRSLPFVIILFGITTLSSRFTNLSPASSALLFPTILLSIIGIFYSSLFQGLKLFSFFALFNISWVLFRLLCILIPFFKLGSLSEVLFLQLFTNILVAGFAYWYLNRLLGKYKINKIHPFSLLKRFLTSWQFTLTLLSILAITFMGNADIIFVKKFFSAQQTSIYSSWSLFSKMIFYVITPLTQISFIFFAGGSKQHLKNKTLLISLAIVICIGIIATFSYAFFGRLLVNILFGNTYASVIPYLGLAGFFGSLYAAIHILNTYFLARKNKAGLILMCIIPVYFFTLFVLPKTLSTVMWVNIIYSVIAATSYMVAFFLTKR